MIKLRSAIICASVLVSCADFEENGDDFLGPSPVLLSLDSTLTSTFFDHGAWFGVNLPSEGYGITAPLLLSDSNGYTFRSPILTGSVMEGGKAIGSPVNSYLPGSLMQTASTNNSNITLKSIYIDHQTLLLAQQVENTADTKSEYSVNWSFPKPDSAFSNQVFYDLKNSLLSIEFHSGSISQTSNITEFELERRSSSTLYIVIRHRFKAEAKPSFFDFKDAPDLFAANNERWNNYMKPYSELSSEKRILASKCIQTLINNWRAPAGELKFEGLFPSYHYEWFHGFWSWDSWKHAVALVTFEPELAKNQIRAMYHFQDEFGMIADVVYRDTLIEKHNWRDTKPPLSGWAIREVYDKTSDTTFVQELLPKLIKYHEWWYENRDHNRNGLCEYGSTDGTRVAAGWESGMDNAVRFDDAQMVRINETAWSLDQESVDLNCYLFSEKQHISYLLASIGEEETASLVESDASKLRSKIQSHFYDTETNYFYDFNTSTKSNVDVIGPEAWITLWSEVATEEQASGVAKMIVDSSHFDSLLPFPTLSASHERFNPEKGYWRGPVWLDQAYFALNGMKKYGFEEDYQRLREKLLNNSEGLLQKGQSIRENYDPRNGKGLNAHHFSWSAAHILMLLNEEIAD